MNDVGTTTTMTTVTSYRTLVWLVLAWFTPQPLDGFLVEYHVEPMAETCDEE